MFVGIGYIYQIHQEPIQLEFVRPKFIDILIHNSYHLFKIISIGILTFCIYNYILLSINGIMVGVGFGLYVQAKNSLFVFLSSFVPHAIFELPDIILGASLPLMFYKHFLTSLRKNKNIFLCIKNSIVNHVMLPTATAFTLIFIAAVFESYISKY